MVHEPQDETYEQAKQRFKAAAAEVWHAAVNLGPEWVEERFGLQNPLRHVLGKTLAISVIGLVLVANWAIGAMIFGMWDK